MAWIMPCRAENLAVGGSGVLAAAIGVMDQGGALPVYGHGEAAMARSARR
jgi:hypothetical protein